MIKLMSVQPWGTLVCCNNSWKLKLYEQCSMLLKAFCLFVASQADTIQPVMSRSKIVAGVKLFDVAILFCHQHHHVLQRFMGASLQMRESQQQSLGAWQHFHHTAITHYSGFLFDLAECLYDEPLTWSFVKG